MGALKFQVIPFLITVPCIAAHGNIKFGNGYKYIRYGSSPKVRKKFSMGYGGTEYTHKRQKFTENEKQYLDHLWDTGELWGVGKYYSPGT